MPYPMGGGFSRVPDWIGKVLPPSSEMHGRAEKIPFYARAGIGHAWVVNTHEQTVEAYRLDGASEVRSICATCPIRP